MIKNGKDRKKKILEFCRRGPALARVEEVKVREGRFKGDFMVFEIVY